MANRFYVHFLRLPLLMRILVMALLLFFIFGVFIHLIEPRTFPTLFDGIWWAIITASTVGYGDLVPQSLLGKLATVILILFGAGFVSSYFITLAAAAVTHQDALSDGKLSFKGDQHLIIIGWNERSRELIQKLSTYSPPQYIVLIDGTLKANPVASRYVHFIQGRPNKDETILKGNIERAAKVLITADRGNDELQADMSSILTLLTIKGLCPQVKCIVEILTSEQATNAKRAGADEVIQSNQLTSVFMENSLRQTHDGLLSDVFNQLQQNRLELVVDKSVIGQSFMAVRQRSANKNYAVIGIKRGDEILLTPPLTFCIESDDQLVIIK